MAPSGLSQSFKPTPVLDCEKKGDLFFSAGTTITERIPLRNRWEGFYSPKSESLSPRGQNKEKRGGKGDPLPTVLAGKRKCYALGEWVIESESIVRGGRKKIG